MTAKRQVLSRWQRKVERDNWKWWHTSGPLWVEWTFFTG